MPQKPYNECEKFKFRAKNGLHLKLRPQKTSKDDLVNPGDMVTRTGDREISVVSGRVGMYGSRLHTPPEFAEKNCPPPPPPDHN